MAITRWEPFREIQTLRERINHMFEDAIVRPSSMWLADMVEGPAVDVYELDDKFVVEAQVPGFKLEEIEVGLTNRTLTIKAEHKLTEEVKEKTYYQREMRVGTLYRSLLLPATSTPRASRRRCTTACWRFRPRSCKSCPRPRSMLNRC